MWASGNLPGGAGGASGGKITKETGVRGEWGKADPQDAAEGRLGWGAKHHLGWVGVRNLIRYGGWLDAEGGGGQLNQLSRILVKTEQCGEEHGSPEWRPCGQVQGRPGRFWSRRQSLSLGCELPKDRDYVTLFCTHSKPNPVPGTSTPAMIAGEQAVTR